jgi:hypothetical protein
MPKKSNQTTSDDADDLVPKTARDEIVNDEPTKSELKRMSQQTDTNSIQQPLPIVQNTTVSPAAMPPPMPSAAMPPPMPSAAMPPPMPGVTVVDVNNNMGGGMGQSAYMQTQATVQAQAQASVGLAQTNIDDEVIKDQMAKEQEHWVKAYWRPAMGWLYMAICFMDFIGFPMLTIFLPIIFKPFGLTMPYQAWTSLTLSNGGLIHLAFGAILGVSAFTRGQEKIQGMK